MTDSVKVGPERLFLKGFFHLNVFSFWGKGGEGVCYSLTLFFILFDFHHTVLFFLMIKKSEVWLLRNITKMRSLIWYAKPTLDLCMLNTKV